MSILGKISTIFKLIYDLKVIIENKLNKSIQKPTLNEILTNIRELPNYYNIVHIKNPNGYQVDFFEDNKEFDSGFFDGKYILEPNDYYNSKNIYIATRDKNIIKTFCGYNDDEEDFALESEINPNYLLSATSNIYDKLVCKIKELSYYVFQKTGIYSNRLKEYPSILSDDYDYSTITSCIILKNNTIFTQKLFNRSDWEDVVDKIETDGTIANRIFTGKTITIYFKTSYIPINLFYSRCIFDYMELVNIKYSEPYYYGFNTWYIKTLIISDSIKSNNHIFLNCYNQNFINNSKFTDYKLSPATELKYTSLYTQTPSGTILSNFTSPNGIAIISPVSKMNFTDSNITYLLLPESLNIIGTNSSSNITCDNAETVIFPKCIKEFGSYSRFLSAKLIVNEENTKYDSRNDCSAIIETETNTLIRGNIHTTIPTSVINIGADAFSYCKNLVNLVIPNNIISIGNRAFQACDSIINIILSSSLTEIGADSFYLCSKLTNISIPNSVKIIGLGAFSNCSNLANVNLGDGLTNIEDYAFFGCSKLANVIIPNSVINIGEGIFYGCSKITELIIPKSVQTIGGSTEAPNLASLQVDSENKIYDSRNNCNAVLETETDTLVMGCNNTVIPPSTKTIGLYAFAYCNRLSSINIPNSVISIEKGAFNYCNNLTNIDIPNSVINIEESAFNGCKNLVNVSLSSALTDISRFMFGACSKLIEVIIPNSVVKIGDYAFLGCTSLQSIVIPDSVKSIGYCAFNGCTNLTNVLFNPLTEIDADAFRFCSLLPELFSNFIRTQSDKTIYNIVWESGIKYIGHLAFHGCINLTNAIIPKTVLGIGTEAFRGCTKLTTVELPNSVKNVGTHVFYGCTKLATINIPNSLNIISDSMFANCALINIDLPESITSIGNWAFNSCTKLININIPDSVISIGAYAFNGCSRIEAVSLSNSITAIPNGLFYGCTKLKNIIIPENVLNIGVDSFRGCPSLVSIVIPNTTTIINDTAFYGCSSLSNVYLGNSIVVIGELAFYGTKIKNIDIPDSVETIKPKAFSSCKIINFGNTRTTVPDIYSDSFVGVLYIIVPDVLYNDFMNNIYWFYYKYNLIKYSEAIDKHII